MPVSDNSTVLYGFDPAQFIVAVKVVESEVIIYTRQSDQIYETRDVFHPWLVTDKAATEKGLELLECEISELEGEGLNRLLRFSDWASYSRTREILREAGCQILAFSAPEKQFLVDSGMTLFKGMTFDSLRRMQLDIETTPCGPDNDHARIIMIGLSDNTGWEQVLEGHEVDIFNELIEVFRERDPDVIEGHNIFGFDLPYIAKRAERIGVSVSLGRDGSNLTFGQKRNCPIGGYSKPFTPVHIAGRQIIDTLLAVQRYDVTRGRLERYGLKEVTRVLGIAEPERVVIPGNEISHLYKTDPELVKTYNLQDVRETRSLADLVCQAEFYLTGMIPENYETVSVTGNGEKINSIFIREYLRQGIALPMPMQAMEVPGGYTDILATGFLQRIVKCDVESLYPSLMLSMGIKPATDSLNVFLPALDELTKRRIGAKQMAQQALDKASREYWDGIQASYKILINSFYGYLGGSFNFNDYEAASRITLSGQETVKRIAASISEKNGRVIEIDTDGVYFQAPDGIETLQDEELLVEQIGNELPAGIRLAHDGRYQAMISLKVKNYALINYDGTKIFKGAALRSRSDEAFGKEFISRTIDLLVTQDYDQIKRLYHDTVQEILDGKLPVDSFSRRERITGKTFTSAMKKRAAHAAEGIQVGEFIEVYERRDGTLGLVENYAQDENRQKLLEKLYKFAGRLKPAFADEFDRIFDKPAVILKNRTAKESGQTSMDLF